MAPKKAKPAPKKKAKTSPKKANTSPKKAKLLYVRPQGLPITRAGSRLITQAPNIQPDLSDGNDSDSEISSNQEYEMAPAACNVSILSFPMSDEGLNESPRTYPQPHNSAEILPAIYESLPPQISGSETLEPLGTNTPWSSRGNSSIQNNNMQESTKKKSIIPSATQDNGCLSKGSYVISASTSKSEITENGNIHAPCNQSNQDGTHGSTFVPPSDVKKSMTNRTRKKAVSNKPVRKQWELRWEIPFPMCLARLMWLKKEEEE